MECLLSLVFNGVVHYILRCDDEVRFLNRTVLVTEIEFRVRRRCLLIELRIVVVPKETRICHYRNSVLVKYGVVIVVILLAVDLLVLG